MDLNILISGLTTEDVPCTIPLAGVGVHTDRVALAHLARPLELLHVGLPDPVVLLPVLVEEEPHRQRRHDAQDPELLRVRHDQLEPL